LPLLLLRKRPEKPNHSSSYRSQGVMLSGEERRKLQTVWKLELLLLSE